MKPYTIFVFAYYSYRDPVFQSAVLPLIEPPGPEARVVLLTFEQEQFALSDQERISVKTALAEKNILWQSQKWHSGRFKAIKKVFDFITGILRSIGLIWRHRAKVVYTEGIPGCLISDAVARITGRPHVIHTLEPHADYMVEGGVWKESDWEPRLLNRYMTKVVRRATLVMTATESYLEQLQSLNPKGQLVRFPSVVDTSLFQYKPEARSQIRRALGIIEEEKLVLYLGKFGGMYWAEEIGEFASTLVRNSSRPLRFVVLSGDPHETIEGYFSNVGILGDQLHVTRVSREEVPYYLSAADFGICAVRNYPSKRYCSPIKDGEYWACGLPFFIPMNVSDDWEYVAKNPALGVVIPSLDQIGYEQATKQLNGYWEQNIENARQECRSFVMKDRDLTHYRNLLWEKLHDIVE